ncbi:MAG: hypothetical protein FJ125_09650, partial [Deltaproteobacteria bacterium]|nr:hypothetical protein [Deltaproteobacteria bacterium]
MRTTSCRSLVPFSLPALLSLLVALLAAGCSEATSTTGKPKGSCIDRDGDGYGIEGSTDCPGHEGSKDCDDASPAVHPGATDLPGNGIDEDCNGSDAVRSYDCQDMDGDGYGRQGHSDCPKSSLPDCNDADVKMNPGAREIPANGKDDDCKDGDQPAAGANCVDQDRDGYGTQAKHDCGARQQVDCDDADPERSPGVEERCNDKDDDCDGQTDECPDGKICHAERRICIAELHGGCNNDQDCNEGLRCDTGKHQCLGWTGSSCQADGDCFDGHCNRNVQPAVCVGTSCEVLQCEDGRCREDIGCYECEDSVEGNGCDEGVCAGYRCFVGDQYLAGIFDDDLYPPMLQLADLLIDCQRRKGGQPQPFLCGGI